MNEMSETPETLKMTEIDEIRKERRCKMLNILKKEPFNFSNFYRDCLPWDNLAFKECLAFLASAALIRQNGTSYNADEFINHVLQILKLPDNVMLKGIKIDDIVKAWSNLSEWSLQWIVTVIDRFEKGSKSRLLLESLLAKFYKNSNNSTVKK